MSHNGKIGTWFWVNLFVVLGMFLAGAACSEMPSREVKVVPVHFESVKMDQKYLNPLEKEVIGQVVREEVIRDSEVLIVSQQGGFVLNAVMKIADSYYEIGPVAFGNNSELINVGMAQLFGKSLLRVEGFCGVACPTVYYLDVSGKWPLQYFYIGAGVREVDLDDDGINELVASSGAPVKTSVYKWFEEGIKKVNINETIDMESVSFSYDDKFIAYDANHSVTEAYRLTEQGLQLIQ